MTTRSAKGNPPTFAASVCFREAGFFNTSICSLMAWRGACGTHAGQWPSRRVARAVRSGVTEGHVSVRTKNGIITAPFERVMSMVNENDQANRAISKAKLHALLHVHTPPINVVVFHGPDREHSFSGWFPA